MTRIPFPKISCRDILFSRMKRIYPILSCSLWKKLVDGSASTTLTSDTNFTADLSLDTPSTNLQCHETLFSLRWRHNDHAGVSNRQPHGCLLNRLFRRKSKKTSKLRVTGLCAGNSPGTGEFPAQMASYAENVSIWWRHHVFYELVAEWVTRFFCGRKLN